MRYNTALALALPGLALGSPVIDIKPRSNTTASPDIEAYKWSSQTIISNPQNPEFFNATERWTILDPPTYQLSVSPATENDVITAVKFATQNHVPFLATGGRHGYTTTTGQIRNGLAIDLSLMNSVKVNKKDATLTIGPGVRFRDIFDPVYEAGFQVQTGTCSCVGMMGATLGGGIGRLEGLDGMIVDALVSARVVTADGKVLTVSEKSNPDLFWGMRGAGFNFGIVTEATYKLHPLYKKGIWTSADIILSADKNVTFFNTLASMFPLPADLTVETVMNYNQTTNEPQVLVSVVYAGPQDEGVKAMAEILKIEAQYSSIKEIPWNHLSTEATFGLDAEVCVDQTVWDIRGISLRQFSAETMATVFSDLRSFWAENPHGLNTQVVLESWPIEAAVAVPDDATAYPWRDTSTYVMVQARWNDPTDPVKGPSNDVSVKIRSELVATSGYDDLAVYVNYANGDETPEQIYGKDKLPRLVALKNKYDPHNVFRWYNGLPTSYHP
ncbi:hypothetical protein GGR50DRAFT_695729 [Xylaria sp. CBS 124048]|nr:hypothetical protein GGR50DRAFT_695729 [Xylaria sp. CBS 124048]